MKPIRLIASFLTVGFWTLLSRLLGFVRDIMIAAYLGAGPVAEAFLVAFALPNMFRRFFAEGAFNMAFVPMFSKRLETGEGPQGFAKDAMSGLTAILVVLTLVAQAAMPWLVLAMASGFRGDERFDLAVAFGRIAFPYILFISLAALFSGVLNAAGRFAAAAAAPLLLNLTLVLAIWLAAATGWDIGLVLSWGVPVAGAAQLALVWWAAAQAGFPLRPGRPRLTPEMKRLAVIATPAMLAGGVVQVNLLIGRQVASFFEGAVAWLGYADRLYQLPLGVVAIAIGVVLLPDLSRRLAEGDTEGGRDAYSRAMEFSLMLTVPAAAALVAIPIPLIQVLFERGQFGPDDTAATALALAVYGAGLPAFVMQKVLQPLFFAREDTRRPFYYALGALAVNAAVAIGLAPIIGFIAAAIATTIAGWAMVWQLWYGARSFGEAARLDARCRRRLPRILIAAFAMGLAVWAGNLALSPLFGEGATQVLALFLLILLGFASYFGIGHLIGAFRLSEFARAFRRRSA
jgi:putative peptidoglycan lipid II flippase